MKMVKWPDIKQYRDAIKNVTHKTRFRGVDAEGKAIYDPLAKLPVLAYRGTVKLHGTNAAVCRKVSPQADAEFWCQSRENIITPDKDNAGFAMFAHHSMKDEFMDLLVTAIGVYGFNKAWNYENIMVYGEWCGGNIQAGVAITGLPKMFVIFGIAFGDENNEKTYFSDQQMQDVIDGCREYVNNDSPIKFIADFPTYHMQIDFENPHESQNLLNDITNQVEAQCPVGHALGKDGIGEGVVWTCVEKGWEDSAFWFKVKGDQHSKSKVKTLAAVDVEKINNIKALAERLAHNGRLDQMYQKVFDTLNGGEPDITRMGEFIKSVMSDIVKEEMDVIAASGFNMKEISGPVSKVAKDFLLKKLEV